MKRVSTILSVSLLLLLVLLFLPFAGASAQTRQGIIIDESWENLPYGKQDGWYSPNAYNCANKWSVSGNGRGGNNYMEVVGDVVKSGNKALKIYAEYPNFRSALSPCPGPGHGHYFLSYATDHWIGFSVYIPPDYICDKCNDPKDSAAELFFQIHGRPDQNEIWRNPVVAIQIERDVYTAFVRGDTAPMSTDRIYDRSVKYTLGKWKTGWNNWVVQYRPGYKDSQNPMMKVWLNGDLIIDDKGINAFNDVNPPTTNFGMYKFSWGNGRTDANSRTLYFDEIRIGNNSSDYASVFPGGGRSSTPPVPSEKPMPTNTPVPPTATPVPPSPSVVASPTQVAITGDFDNSDCVNIIDFGILIQSFNLTPGETGYNSSVNLDDTPTINIFDFQIFIQNFGRGCSS